MMVKPAALFGKPLGEMGLYYLCIFVTVVVVLVAVNVIRSPTAAPSSPCATAKRRRKSMGVDSARYKTFAFACPPA